MNRDRHFQFIKENFILAILKQPPRRKEILMLFRQNTLEEIAAKFHIEENTISKHISNFFKDFKFKTYFPDYSSKELPQLLKRLLDAYVDNIVAEEIRKSIYLRDEEENKNVSPNQKRGKTVIVLDIDSDRVDISNLLAYLKNFQAKSGDSSMKIHKVEDGSLKLTLTGTVEGCQRIKSLFDAGDLTEILDIPILDVSSVEVETENNFWTNLSNWRDSNILSDWEVEEIVSGTIAAFKLNPNFLAIPAFGLQMNARNEEELNALIPELLTHLDSQDLNIVRLAAQRLGEIKADPPEVINSLKEKLSTTEDRETQWQIALTLGKIVPEEHPNARSQKQTIELGNITLELILAIKNDADDFVDILIEIRSDWDDYLPAGLEVKILEESGENFWQDDFIATQSVSDEQAYIDFNFWGTLGDRFIVQLSLEDNILQKNFQV